MSTQSISTSLTPNVVIAQVSGDLNLKGWDKPEIIVIARQEDLNLEEGDDEIRLSCQGTCEVRIPQGASLQIKNILGDAQLKFLDEPVAIGTVQGSLTIRQVAALQVEIVNKDLSIRSISGDFRAKQLMGNAELRKIQGSCILDAVQGRLDGWALEGEIRVHARGRVYLHLSAMRGTDYQIHSESDVHCYIPEDASLKLDLSSRSKLIKMRIGEETATVYQDHYEQTTNSGAASMAISAGGSIYLLSRKPEWGDNDEDFLDALPRPDAEDFSPEIAQRVQEHIKARMEALVDQMDEEITRITERIGETGLSPESTNQIIEQAKRTSERETVRAQAKIRRAQEKLERKLTDVQRRQERRAEEFDRRTRHGKHSWSFPWPTPTTQTQLLENEPVCEEERLMILRMLEQKKITLEEADRLLATLEGKEE